jgi:hypothetical protein
MSIASNRRARHDYEILDKFEAGVALEGTEVKSVRDGRVQLNHQLPMGAFSVVGRDIFFAQALLGRALDRKSLLGTIAAVAEISDEYDDRIVERYGGQTALDRIRDTGGRKKRREAAN